MQFAHPIYLWLIPALLVPLIVWYIFKQRNARASMAMSTTQQFARLGIPWRAHMRHVIFALRLLTFACLLVILARPQLKNSWQTTPTEGTDIILALDVSTSMLARDFQPNRFEAAKDMAQQFISGRDGDNIGVVIFAGESLTGVPMTVDHSALLNYINSLRMNSLPDGTAIGDGIATSLNRLKDGKAKSQSIILLTDGSNNTGIVAPLTAANIAKEMGVKIYTIGVGSNTTAPMPVRTAFGVEYQDVKVVIDEATLRQIAEETNGKYFRATNNKVLAEVFEEIDQLEKTRMDVRHFTHTEDDYMLFAWIAFALIFVELLLRYTVTRSIP
ncbi:MAG: VWA domain-containing protein [Muribaculaceae bacterium]|nr:VWA domain-containing protein [Muribaculaceae bacterium]